MNNRISIHHIGGRDGNGAFPLNPQFLPDMVLTFYEADADCIDQIKERSRYLKSQVNVLPFCIGAGTGQATLFINYDPYTSSLLPANPAYRDYRIFSNYGAFGREFDWVVGQALRPMEQRVLNTVGLDDLLHSGRLGATPDFLSVDTQGSEFNILTGAREVLKTTLAVSCEVEFHPMYQGQKLFGDVANLMASQGFLFVSLSHDQSPLSPYNTPITLRGAGIQLGDDALFIRTPESLATHPDETERCLMLHKLAFLALVLGQVEIAAQSLRLTETSPSLKTVRDALAGLGYGCFLNDFWTAVKRQPRFFLSTFESEFTFEASRARFATSEHRGVRWLEKIRDWCVRKPGRWQLLKKLLHPLSAGARRFTLFFKLTRSGKPFWRHPAFQWRNEVERVLRRYGLDEVEKTVRHNRWRVAAFSQEG